ncbi:uncharacterized protein LAESUDRAFT_444467 [Laetiporus sulphureus 93-53]|uniref:Uncharacterized protein n=1 Tax=Laetiporus sulphureus 93-53 TaxID=1314785 RepID=A0A165C0J7_9APHY|nr:uncharacterized protein LAESUDRAFT_444467 [Laetiporus sulphureus 93-53]KZT01980.1 hypothetical protein LAESUDRAFT_444467 [Laetiporus sulphureus 93-53]
MSQCMDMSCACVDSYFTSAASCMDCMLPLIPDTGNCSASVVETEWQESINGERILRDITRATAKTFAEVYEQCLANGFAVNSVSLSYAPTATGRVSTTSLSGSGTPLTTAASDGSTTSTAAANGSTSGAYRVYIRAAIVSRSKPLRHGVGSPDLFSELWFGNVAGETNGSCFNAAGRISRVESVLCGLDVEIRSHVLQCSQ